jgi:hypothetical protein
MVDELGKILQLTPELINIRNPAVYNDAFPDVYFRHVFLLS